MMLLYPVDDEEDDDSWYLKKKKKKLNHVCNNIYRKGAQYQQLRNTVGKPSNLKRWVEQPLAAACR